MHKYIEAGEWKECLPYRSCEPEKEYKLFSDKILIFFLGNVSFFRTPLHFYFRCYQKVFMLLLPTAFDHGYIYQSVHRCFNDNDLSFMNTYSDSYLLTMAWNSFTSGALPTMFNTRMYMCTAEVNNHNFQLSDLQKKLDT